MNLHHWDFIKPDGRTMRFYARAPLEPPSVIHPGIVRAAADSPAPWRGPQLRQDHLTGAWVSLSAARQGRPHLPSQDQCPLCPPTTPEAAATTELPFFDPKAPRFSYEWVSFENLYPALSSGGTSEAAGGHCEVVLFRRQHEGHFCEMSFEDVRGVIAVWQDRSRVIGAMSGIQSVFLFENRGAEIGVTLHHPHGQIYAFPHIPPRLRTQLDHAEQHYSRYMGCLICDATKETEDLGRLVLFSGRHLLAFMPEAPRFPYELHITTRHHRTHIEDLDAEETDELARLIKAVVAMYDNLFEFPLPYIMQHHQCPSGARNFPSYHWNIQITPFHRSRDRLKYLAGAETGMGFFVNDSLPEEKILELRRHFAFPEDATVASATGTPNRGSKP